MVDKVNQNSIWSRDDHDLTLSTILYHYLPSSTIIIYHYQSGVNLFTWREDHRVLCKFFLPRCCAGFELKLGNLGNLGTSMAGWLVNAAIYVHKILAYPGCEWQDLRSCLQVPSFFFLIPVWSKEKEPSLGWLKGASQLETIVFTLNIGGNPVNVLFIQCWKSNQ